MLGSTCSPCCNCPKCTTGKLPDAVTVTIEGKIHGQPVTVDGKTKYPEQPKAGLGKILRTKVKSNFGSGARIRIDEPGGFPPSENENDCPSDAGPISSGGTIITAVDPPPGGEKPNGTDGFWILGTGSGYAQIKRVKPNVTARLVVPGGEEFGCDQATVNVEVEEGSDGGLPFWFISSATIDNDCSVFGSTAAIVFDFESGTVIVEQPYVNRYLIGDFNGYASGNELVVKGYFYKPDTDHVIKADVEVEIIQQSPSDGSGAQIKANIQDDPTKPGFGSILSYTIESAGDGYLAWYYYYPCVCEPHEYVLPRIGNSCIYQQCRCEGLPSAPLVTLAATSCTGSGGTGAVTKPFGIPGKADGEITETTVTNAGTGYAVLGRIEPTVNKVSGGTGGGLEITTTLTPNDGGGKCSLPTWGIESVSVTKGGWNYTDGDVLTFATDGQHDETPGTGEVKKTTTARPTLEAQPAGGLTFSLTTVSNADTPETWGVSTVTFSGDPAGWLDEQGVGINATGEHDTTIRPADVRIRTRREQPTISAAVSDSSAGGGASLGVTLSQFTGTDKRDQWKVTAVTGGGGTGYSSGDHIAFTVESDQTNTVKAAAAHVSKVNEDGAITNTSVAAPGAYWRDTGEAENIEIRDGGLYAIVGIVQEIEVTLAGHYYNEDPSADPIIPAITVTVTQSVPSNGTGAKFGATVFNDPQDPSFGGIKAFTIEDGGSGYLAATTLTENCYSVEYKGPTEKAVFKRVSELCTYTFEADELITDCDKFSWVHTPASCGGMKITVAPGGKVSQSDGDDACCGCCCTVPADPPDETAKVTVRPSACHDAYGTYIANKKCDDTKCPDTVSCCVPPVIIGAEDAAQCEDVFGGTVLPKNSPPETCDPGNPCACAATVAGYDFAQCAAHGFAGIQPADVHAVRNGVIANDGNVGGGACGGRYVFLIRNAGKVDFGEHCNQQWFCNGDRLKYLFLNCQTGEAEVHDATDYYTVHDAVAYRPSDELPQFGMWRPVEGLGDDGGACAVGIIHAP
jgi:hypothetical protein